MRRIRLLVWNLWRCPMFLPRACSAAPGIFRARALPLLPRNGPRASGPDGEDRIMTTLVENVRASKAPWRSVKYRRWIASHPCVMCGCLETQAAHTETGGMSTKAPDYTCVPLCLRHHDEFDGRRPIGHAGTGRETFQRVYHVDLTIWAEAFHEMWKRETGQGRTE